MPSKGRALITHTEYTMFDQEGTFIPHPMSPSRAAVSEAAHRLHTTNRGDFDRLDAQQAGLHRRVRRLEAGLDYQGDLIDAMCNRTGGIDEGAVKAAVTAEFDERKRKGELMDVTVQNKSMGFWGFLGMVVVARSLTWLISKGIERWMGPSRKDDLSPDQIAQIKAALLGDDKFLGEMGEKLRPYVVGELRLEADVIEAIAKKLKERQGWCSEVFELSGHAQRLRGIDGSVQDQAKVLRQVSDVLRNAKEQHEEGWDADGADEMSWALVLCRDLADIDGLGPHLEVHED